MNAPIQLTQSVHMNIVRQAPPGFSRTSRIVWIKERHGADVPSVLVQEWTSTKRGQTAKVWVPIPTFTKNTVPAPEAPKNGN